MIKKVSLVILPIDDFIDKPIKSGINISAFNGSIRPIKKDDGFFVFTNIDMPSIDININAYSYSPLNLTIDLTKLNILNPVVKVRLKPNEKYNFLHKTTCLKGITDPNTTITVIHNCRNNIYRLYEDTEKCSSKIKIYNPLNIDLEGKNYIVNQKGFKKKEEFCVVEFDEKNGDYILDVQLKHEYKKESCEIIKIDKINIFEDGKYFLPLKNITQNQNQIILIREDGKEINVDLKDEIINEVNFI